MKSKHLAPLSESPKRRFVFSVLNTSKTSTTKISQNFAVSSPKRAKSYLVV